MNRKKIIFLLNHFQYSDGVAMALVNIVNSLNQEKFDITIKPLYKFEKELANELNEGIKIEPAFGFYFKGMAKLLKIIPIDLLYKKIVGLNYDIEVAFQCDISTLLVGHSLNNHAVHVAWMHGYEIYPQEYMKMDKVVCVSKYCRDKAQSEIPECKNIICKYNLVQENVIKKQSEDIIDNNLFDSDNPIFVSVGRHSEEKGYVRLINIFKELKDEGYQFKMILVGDGPEHQNIVNEVKNLGLDEDVILIGMDKNPHKYTAKSDVFICSSYSEGYSTACAEAAVLGIPIITTDVPGGKEIIDDCECGILTENTDESLKNGIKHVLENGNEINDWKNIMKNTSCKFGIESRKKEMLHFFDEIYSLSCIREE